MNLIEELELRGIDYRQHGEKPDEIFLCCPFCGDTRYRLGINVVTGWMNCFNGGCTAKSRSKDYTFREIQRVLGTGELEAASSRIQQQKKPNKKVELPDDFQLVQAKYTKDRWHNIAFEYLRTRGVTGDQIKAKGIGYSLVGEFRYRIIIPVYEKDKLVGMVARAFVRDLEPKYKNSHGQKSLYNLCEEVLDSAILVEGAFDALACERAMGNYYDCLGVLGHALTDRQIKQLKPYKRIVLWPDPDDAGVNGFLRMAKILEQEGKWVGMVLPKLDGSEEYDPSDLDIKEIRKKMNGMVRHGPEVENVMRAKLAFQEQ